MFLGGKMITKKFLKACVEARGAFPQIKINSTGPFIVMPWGCDFDVDPATGRAMLN